MANLQRKWWWVAIGPLLKYTRLARASMPVPFRRKEKRTTVELGDSLSHRPRWNSEPCLLALWTVQSCTEALTVRPYAHCTLNECIRLQAPPPISIDQSNFVSAHELRSQHVNFQPITSKRIWQTGSCSTSRCIVKRINSADVLLSKWGISRKVALQKSIRFLLHVKRALKAGVLD